MEPTVIENKNRNADEARSIQVAEESRELAWKSKSFMASMFMGDLDLDMALPFPEQSAEDRAEGDAFLARVKAWADEHLDGEAIDREQEIPPHVFKGAAELGLFGIKIPKEYGGLGMSQTNYVRVLGVISTYCGSMAATLSAHQSIGVPQPLKLFGTPEQKKKYLPRVARGELSAFALTEPNAGSDPATMTTTATPTEDGKHWVLNGLKLWCTNGVVADLLVVMARTPSKFKNGKEIKQITAFIVEGSSPGVEILHRCRFLGLRAIENGLIRFNNVLVPAENIIAGEGKGLKLALTTLNDGRLGIPAVAAVSTQAVADLSSRWAKTRQQWGKRIGEHEAGALKLADLHAGSYAMETLALYGAALSDRGDTDIRMEAATAKMFNSELCWTLMDTALQLRAGRGYETPASLRARGEHDMPLERALRDSRINRIVEGTTDIMHLFLAREALDGHLRLAGPLLSRADAGTKLKALLRCAAFYPLWYTRLWVGGLFRSFARFPPELRANLAFVESSTRHLARTLFHKMALQGPKLEMRQLTLARLVDIGAELAVMALVAARVQGELARGERANLAKAVYWLEARKGVVNQLFEQVSSNADAQARALAEQLLAQAEVLPELELPALEPQPRLSGGAMSRGEVVERGQGVGQAAK